MRVLFIFVVMVAAVSCSQQKSAQLERKVIWALERDARTTLSSFEVTHQGAGEVVISGDVSNNLELAAVSEIAKSVNGVNRVVNNCIAPLTPEEIIRDSLVAPVNN